MIKRYTQGFGYFGPMEQSNDGKWVKCEDHENRVDSLKQQYRELHTVYTNTKEELFDTIRQLADRIIACLVFSFLEAIIIVILSILYFVK